MSLPPDLVDAIVAEVLHARKYAAICPDTVRAVAQAELRASRSVKEAVKRVKRKLHQIGGAYQAAPTPYAAWLAELRAAPDRPTLLALSRRMMAAHASSQERLAYLDEFYAHIFGHLGTVSAVLDLACGLNPLAIPWMGLSPATRYDCADIYSDQMAFLQAWIELIGQPGKATCHDVLLQPPAGEYSVALLLKSMPCLQQLDATATERLIASIAARHIVVSFPSRSLGGRDVGMVEHYRRGFEELLERQALAGEGQLVGDELVYIVETRRIERDITDVYHGGEHQ
ncbi:MAG: 16S rRNA methyltransferase [Anaerolineae bacterium]|jgi:16S rRNA (guanine(1405)-N(7))-methyltransferase